MISANGRTVQTFTDGYGRVRLDTLDGLPGGGFNATLNYSGNDRYLAAGSATVAVPNLFVTGGGWIMTPAESIGFVVGKKANFALNVKYKTGGIVPTGNFDFQAKESGITFRATSFDLMAVSGKTADVQGRGTVNGVSGWTFRVRAVEGSPDSITVSIWRDGTDLNGDPTYRAGNALGGGNVVVH